MHQHLVRLGQNYQMCSVLADRAGLARWQTKPKLHYTCGHLAAQAELINPMKVQGYCSESMVGEICCVYKMSQNGPHLDRIQWAAMLKYRTDLHLQWA